MMNSDQPDKWTEIKALFHRALELRPEERQAFLNRACSADPEVRSELESLLASHDDDRPFLDTRAIAGVAHAMAGGVDDIGPFTELRAGSRIGHYEILECIGTGGMGEVYRAHDTRLDRAIALKIVHDSATGSTVDRVLREARAASALNHPHICTIYEVGEFDGRPYLAMEYIAGQSLSNLIPSQGLPAKDVVRYGAQMADALAHAHEHRVIHRDLKAANVTVTPQGRAKVLDFGVARRLPAVDITSRPATLTEAGAITGTPAYMAPELLRGQPADVRSDIWSLGVLLYEMASGRRPFEGETPFELASAILKDTPPPLPAKVPARLRSVILRCLARDPEERYQQASDLSVALEAAGQSTRGVSLPRIHVSRRLLVGLGAAAALLLLASVTYQRSRSASDPQSGTLSIAVLPFRVLSGVDDIGFLGIGLPDTIISRLAGVEGMRVRPTSAVLAWEKDSIDPQQAGHLLDVHYVLTGTLQKSGDKIRVGPQLVRVIDGVPIWTRQYTLASTDLLDLQDEIAAAVVDVLKIQVTSADRARVYRRYTQDPDAYALYVRGRSELVRRQRESTTAAVRSFEAALARDQDYALAHAGLAMASAQMRLFFAPEAEVSTWETRAHQAARRALQLRADLAESHEALAAVYRSAEFDWHQAIEESAKALALNPNLDQPHLYRASGFSHLGLLDRVGPEANAAMEINPANIAEPLRVQGVTAMFAGRFADAVALLEKARSASGRLAADWNLAHAYYYAGRKTEAETMLRELRGSARSERRGQATLASFLAARGSATEANKLIDVVTSASYMDHHVAYALGAAYAQLDQPVEALRWLTQARSTGLPCYPWFERDPLLAPLKEVPAFRQFLEELKRSWDTAAARHQGQ